MGDLPECCLSFTDDLPTPKEHLLNFFGAVRWGRTGFGTDLPYSPGVSAGDPRIPTAVAIDVCQRIGVGERTVRSTLTRMVTRDLLNRSRFGRTARYGLTDRSRAVLDEGHRRIWETGAIRLGNVEASWVLLGFSMPTDAQSERHVLRSRLQWMGFGPLQAGLWLAPSPVDIDTLMADDEIARLRPHLRIFNATPHPATNMEAVSREVWDLEALAERYRHFHRTWSNLALSPCRHHDPLTLQLLLSHDWLKLLRQDPRLPPSCLPREWPASAAESCFAESMRLVAPTAAAEVQKLLETWG